MTYTFQFLQSMHKLVTPIGTPRKEVKVKIERHLVTTETNISKCSN